VPDKTLTAQPVAATPSGYKAVFKGVFLGPKGKKTVGAARAEFVMMRV